MGNQAEQPKTDEARPMTETREIPPLILRRDSLVFSAGEKSVTVKLSALMEAGENAVVGLLLWGLLLKLHDLELDFRRAIEFGEKRASEAMAFTNDPSAIFEHVQGALKKLGVELPEGGLGELLRTSDVKRTPIDPTRSGDGTEPS